MSKEYIDFVNSVTSESSKKMLEMFHSFQHYGRAGSDTKSVVNYCVRIKWGRRLSSPN